MITDVVIIGGGVAGIHCAAELSKLGVRSAIVEKEPYPGGHVASYCCKATDQCQRCGACILEDQLSSFGGSESINWLLRSTVTNVARSDGFFLVTLDSRPIRIYPDRCNDCGKCLEACPAPDALFRSPVKNWLVLNEDRCLFFKDGSCRACQEICSEGAVNLGSKAEEHQVQARAVILACGFKAFDPREKPRFGYGRIPGVITALELDSILRKDNFNSGEGNRKLDSVAFIQCVGSRDPRIGRNYCSQVCCGYALRLAEMLRHRFQVIHPTVFYMDIQSFDRDFEPRLRAIRENVRLVRAIPAEIRRGADNRPELVYRGPNEERIAESFDLVVLSVGISPDPQLLPLANLLGVETNQDAFLGRDGDEVLTDAAGVFVAGAVNGPKSIEETVFHSIRAAGMVASYLMGPCMGENR
jgi:heterodisulfide reductase subunit A2